MYKQHFPKILGAIQIPNPAYATTIAIAFQVAMQVAIAHHGTMPNNPNPVLTLVNLSLQQLIVAIANILPTIYALAFANPVGESFQVLELKFSVKSSKFFLQFTTFFR